MDGEVIQVENLYTNLYVTVTLPDLSLNLHPKLNFPQDHLYTLITLPSPSQLSSPVLNKVKMMPEKRSVAAGNNSWAINWQGCFPVVVVISCKLFPCFLLCRKWKSAFDLQVQCCDCVPTASSSLKAQCHSCSAMHGLWVMFIIILDQWPPAEWRPSMRSCEMTGRVPKRGSKAFCALNNILIYIQYVDVGIYTIRICQSSMTLNKITERWNE